MFAEHMLPHLKAPVFPINSLYDSVTIPVIIGADCLKNRSLADCSP